MVLSLPLLKCPRDNTFFPCKEFTPTPQKKLRAKLGTELRPIPFSWPLGGLIHQQMLCGSSDLAMLPALL